MNKRIKLEISKELLYDQKKLSKVLETMKKEIEENGNASINSR